MERKRVRTGFYWGSLNIREHLEVARIDLIEIGSVSMNWILLD